MIQNSLEKNSNYEDRWKKIVIMKMQYTTKQTENFVNWCDKDYLYLNVSKTRCALILGRIEDAPNQSTLKEKQWRE